MNEQLCRQAEQKLWQEAGVIPTEHHVPLASSGGRVGRLLLSGAVAGAASVVVFTAIHQWLISDIWNTLIPMMVAGALCGLSVAWSYGRLFRRRPSAVSWLLYNLLYVGLLVLLGLASVIVYEPIVTAHELLAAGGAPPNELFRQATPLTVGFILLSTAGIGLLWGRNLLDHVSVLIACTLVIVLLGINLSILGLVQFTSGSLPLLGMTYALVLVLNLVFAAVFMVLERKVFFGVEMAGGTRDETNAVHPPAGAGFVARQP